MAVRLYLAGSLGVWILETWSSLSAVQAISTALECDAPGSTSARLARPQLFESGSLCSSFGLLVRWSSVY